MEIVISDMRKRPGHFRIGLMPWLWWLALAGLLVGCQSPAGKQIADRPLRIATAANMQFAMEALAAAFTAETGTPVELIVSSSGKLKAQIQEGAPYDVFVSADTLYPHRLYREGVGQEVPRIYAYGKLVLWTINEAVPLHLDSLHHPDIQHIAMANPQLAPYGLAARQVLQEAGYGHTLDAKLVRAESIAQTNQFILSGAAEVGFTALAAVKAPTLREQGRWIPLDTSLYAPIAQAALLLKATPPAQSAYDFLFSATAQEVLAEYGYSLP
jgi:molybdate transport system substrate-binding protein